VGEATTTIRSAARLPRWLQRGQFGATLAILWLATVGGLAVLAPWIGLADPLALVGDQVRAAPSAEHWFGTDGLGRDMFSRAVYGGRTSLFVGVVGSLTGATIGTTLGVLAGFTGGRTDSVIMTAMDMMLAFPALVLALTLAALLGPGIATVTVAIVVLSIPVFARAVRSQTLTIASSEFVLAARCMGMADRRILAREVLPNVLPIVIAYGLVVAAVAIIVEGSLSFLGVGVPPPASSWGNLIAAGRSDLARAPHLTMLPAAMMFLTIAAANVLGQRLGAATSGPVEEGGL
jgi:peptide/nickel transport system permease protein